MVLDILRYNLNVKLIRFVDDDRDSHHKVVDGVPVLGSTGSLPELVARHKLDAAIIAVGNNRVRAEVFNRLRGLGLRLENAIHPRSIIARGVEMGEGVVIASGAMVNAGTTIGNNVIINTGVIIDHDNVIEDHTHLSPGAKLAGKVTIKRYAHVGIRATVAQRLTIGEGATVGAGAVVFNDVPENAVAVGVPARILKINGAAADAERLAESDAALESGAIQSVPQASPPVRQEQ